jgi:K+-sensing histidine kinase KdpD
MRRRSEYLVLLRPWSLPAFASAFIAVMFAATMQEFIASFGTIPYFVGFVPAILVASLVGGAPAGTFAAILSVPIIWWAFMPPHFQFNPLTAAQYDSFAAFALVSSLAICFAHLFREALSLIRK